MQIPLWKGYEDTGWCQHSCTTPGSELEQSASTLESACISEVRTNSDRVILALRAHDDANVVSAALAPFPGQASSLNGKLYESRCLKCFFQLLQDFRQITQVQSLYVSEVKNGHQTPPLGTWENSLSLRSAEQPPGMEETWFQLTNCNSAFASPTVCSSAKWGSLNLTPSPGIWKLI